LQSPDAADGPLRDATCPCAARLTVTPRFAETRAKGSELCSCAPTEALAGSKIEALLAAIVDRVRALARRFAGEGAIGV
jgi:hypothetical protein